MTTKLMRGEELDLLKRIIIRCKTNDAGGNDNGYPVNTWDELLQVVDELKDYEDQIDKIKSVCVFEYEGQDLSTVEKLSYAHQWSRNEIRRKVMKIITPHPTEE